jgi:hypothetical protein
MPNIMFYALMARFLLRIKIWNYLYFEVLASSDSIFFCRPFVVIATYFAGLVGCPSRATEETLTPNKTCR